MKKRKEKVMTTKVADQQQQTNFSSLSITELPTSIIMEIFARLPIKSIITCMCVCKEWRSIASDPSFPEFHLSRTSSGILLCRVNTKWDNFKDLYFLDPENKFETLGFNSHFKNSDMFYAVGSCNGLLCLSDMADRDPVFVCNLITGEWLTIPASTLPKENTRPVSGFGFDPISKNYKIIRILQAFNYNVEPITHKSVGAVYTLGSQSWRPLEDIPYRLQCQFPGVFLNGHLHWMTMDCYGEDKSDVIGAFNISEEKFLTIAPPLGYKSDGKIDLVRLYDMNLGVLRDNLCLFDFFWTGEVEIWMMVKYGVKESWSKKYVIYEPNGDDIELPIQYMKPLKILDNGEILLLWDMAILFCYDPVKEVYYNLGRLPNKFEAVPHIASFISPKPAATHERLMRYESDEDRMTCDYMELRNKKKIRKFNGQRPKRSGNQLTKIKSL